MTRAARGDGSLPPRAGSDQSTPRDDGVVPLNSADPMQAPLVRAEDIPARDGLMRDSVVDPEEQAKVPVVEIARWVVLRDQRVSDRGHQVLLKRGKIIDALNYDHKKLLRAGVRLKALDPGDDGSEFLLPEHG